jgi:hypothetical protein
MIREDETEAAGVDAELDAVEAAEAAQAAAAAAAATAAGAPDEPAAAEPAAGRRPWWRTDPRFADRFRSANRR